jgi:hypothetical protein
VTENFFKMTAKKRLMDLHPQDGEMRFDRINEFCEMAKSNPGTFLVVPAEVDQDLHAILSASLPVSNLRLVK